MDPESTADAQKRKAAEGRAPALEGQPGGPKQPRLEGQEGPKERKEEEQEVRRDKVKPTEVKTSAMPISQALITHLTASEFIGFRRLVSQVASSVTMVEVAGSKIARNLARITAYAVRQQFETNFSGKYRLTEIDEIATVVFRGCFDIYGHLLYTRIRHMNHRYQGKKDVYNKPAFGLDVEIPAFVASVINGIGMYRPIDVEDDIVYFPGLSTLDIGHSCTDSNAEPNIIRYVKAQSYMREAKIHFDKVQIKDPYGSSFYLLRQELHSTDKLDVILPFPQGNVTPSEALTFLFTNMSLDENFNYAAEQLTVLHNNEDLKKTDFGRLVYNIRREVVRAMSLTAFNTPISEVTPLVFI